VIDVAGNEPVFALKEVRSFALDEVVVFWFSIFSAIYFFKALG
jgi:hypothetical protein